MRFTIVQLILWLLSPCRGGYSPRFNRWI